jgi:uncharacterized C2H2 Zn-finger protein
MEQVAHRDGTAALYAFRCPNPDCRPDGIYLEEADETNHVRCPGCGRQYEVVVGEDGFYADTWRVSLREAAQR